MSKNILKDMRDQMTPDTELLERVMKRIEDDAVFRVENEYEDSSSIVSAETSRLKHRKRHQNINAALYAIL